jgi:hypothetical protein
MKWYFASRVRHTEKLIQVCKFLESQNHEIGSTWVYGKSLKPYHENVAEVQKVGTENSLEILKSDIFVMISDPEGTDMFVELGIALGKNITGLGVPKIYIVGEYSKRSLMQLHPAVIHVDTLNQVFAYENVNFSSFEIPVFS